MEAPELFERSVALFDKAVAAISPPQWHASTPCADWSVRELVRHLVYEDLWAPDIFAGKTIADVGDAYEGDILGDDPTQTWKAAQTEAVDAAYDTDVDAIVHLSFGDIAAGEYMRQLFADHLIHTWDLAHAIGADEALDPVLVAVCTSWFDDCEAVYRAAGVIGDVVDVAADADPQTRLLARFGRSTNR